MDPKQFKFILWAPMMMSIALVAGLGLLGWQIKDSRTNDTLTVTGSAKMTVPADLGKWQGTVNKNADLTNLEASIKLVADNAKTFQQFVGTLGLDPKSVMIDPVQTDPVYEQLPNYVQTQNVIGYTVRRQVSIESTDIEKIDQLSQRVNELVAKGILFTAQSTEYSVTKLPELRAELYSLATQDAKGRAEAIARGTGVRVGALRTARTGVIQVLKPHSTDVSDYGAYDLSTKEKEISATVSASFALGQ